VRILTNNYNTSPPAGKIDSLTFLFLAGAQVRYYTSTTFIHEKYICVDGEDGEAAVSSVNFSEESFMENREAGVLLSNASETIGYFQEVFDWDFNNSDPFVPAQTYSQSDMNIINDPSPVPVIIPPAKHFKGAYVTTVYNTSGNMSIGAVTSPDFAWLDVSSTLNATNQSLGLYIYQVTDYPGDPFCTEIINLYNRGINLTLLVSNAIYDQSDSESAAQCYQQLYNAGVPLRETALNTYAYSHQKYWIIDGKIAYLSTGNWGSSDFPPGSNSYPPYSSSSWRLINRDFTVVMTDPSLISYLETVLNQDWNRGQAWQPSSSKKNK